MVERRIFSAKYVILHELAINSDPSYVKPLTKE